MAGEAQVVTWKITWTKKQLPSQTALIGHKKSHFFFWLIFFWLARKSVSNMEWTNHRGIPSYIDAMGYNEITYHQYLGHNKFI